MNIVHRFVEPQPAPRAPSRMAQVKAANPWQLAPGEIAALCAGVFTIPRRLCPVMNRLFLFGVAPHPQAQVFMPPSIPYYPARLVVGLQPQSSSGTARAGAGGGAGKRGAIASSFAST